MEVDALGQEMENQVASRPTLSYWTRIQLLNFETFSIYSLCFTLFLRSEFNFNCTNPGTGCLHARLPQYECGSQKTSWIDSFPMHYVGPWGRIQVIRLGSKHPHH